VDQIEASTHSAGTEARAIPTIADVARIAGIEDPVLRNLRITQCYHELAHAWVERAGPDLSWCAFACWSSKHAGHMIRAGELDRAFDARLQATPEATDTLHALADRWARRSWRQSADEIRSVLADLARPGALLDIAREETAAANLEIFSEIGLEFVRFLSAFRDATQPVRIDIDRFCGFLRPGREPAGQELLQRAFRSYHTALFEKNAKMRSELMLFGNVSVAVHEQACLQARIERLLAADAEASEAAGESRQLLDRLRPQTGRFEPWIRRYLVWSTGLEARWRAITTLHRAIARGVVVEQLTTLDLPERRLSFGSDLDRSRPRHLVRLTHGELTLFWSELAPVRNASYDDRAEAWTDPFVRRRFIAELLRTYQDAQCLLQPPFSPEQTAEIRRGHVPEGPL